MEATRERGSQHNTGKRGEGPRDEPKQNCYRHWGRSCGKIKPAPNFAEFPRAREHPSFKQKEMDAAERAQGLRLRVAIFPKVFNVGTTLAVQLGERSCDPTIGGVAPV